MQGSSKASTRWRHFLYNYRSNDWAIDHAKHDRSRCVVGGDEAKVERDVLVYSMRKGRLVTRLSSGRSGSHQRCRSIRQARYIALKFLRLKCACVHFATLALTLIMPCEVQDDCRWKPQRPLPLVKTAFCQAVFDVFPIHRLE
jgi:hypothetical protein